MLLLKNLRLKNKISQQKLAEYLNVSRSTVAMWETEASEPDFSTLEKIADYFGVSVDYLLGRKTSSEAPSSNSGHWIPVLGRVAAGIPIEAIEEIEDYEEITKAQAAQGDLFALKIQGDSMAPRINDGDVIIVRKQNDCDNNDVAVVIVDGDNATVKRIKKLPEGIMLIPNNPAYEPKFFSNEDIEKLPVKILGKVIELRAKF